MQKINTIAIDGPAASGKSTLAQRLADHLGYLIFDTGIMYRAVTYAAMQEGVDLADAAACTRVAENTRIDIRPTTQTDGRPVDVLINDEDCTWAIRQPEVEGNVSIVAAYPGVRRALTEQQRRIGLQGQVVMVGRDIGTVVLPEAILKIYLDATVEERARRRHEERQQAGSQETYAAVLESMRQRDQLDEARAIAPLRPAEDAEVISSDQRAIEDILAQTLALLEARRHGG